MNSTFGKVLLGVGALGLAIGLWLTAGIIGTGQQAAGMEANILAQIKGCATIRDTGWQTVQGKVKLTREAAGALEKLYGSIFQAANAQQTAGAIAAFGTTLAQNSGGSLSEIYLDTMRTLESQLAKFSDCQNTVAALQANYARFLGYPSGDMVGRVTGAWPNAMFAQMNNLPHIISGADTKFLPAGAVLPTVFTYQPLVLARTAEEFQSGTLNGDIIPATPAP